MRVDGLNDTAMTSCSARMRQSDKHKPSPQISPSSDKGLNFAGTGWMAQDCLTNCGHSRLGRAVIKRREELVVDLHCHLNVAAAEQYVRKEVPDAPDPLTFVSAASRATNAKLFAEIGAKLNGINERLLDMDCLGSMCRPSAHRRGNITISHPRK
jgi:hypothetical protein